MSRPFAVVALLATVAVAAAAIADPANGRAHPDDLVGDCSACHTAGGWELSGAAGAGGFDHARTGFPLTGRHGRAGCIDCHARGREIDRACSSCHVDPHAARLGDSCDACHSASDWLVTRAIERHRRTRLPLDGMHALVDCLACHRRASDRTWSGVSPDCFSCHEDDYRRGDVHPDHTGGGTSAPLSRDCGRCHRTLGWSPAFVPAEGVRSEALARARGHDLRFPISFGPHRGAPCTACHAAGEARAAPSCAGCHAHAPARLASQHPGRRISARTCLSCHPGGMSR